MTHQDHFSPAAVTILTHSRRCHPCRVTEHHAAHRSALRLVGPSPGAHRISSPLRGPGDVTVPGRASRVPTAVHSKVFARVGRSRTTRPGTPANSTPGGTSVAGRTTVPAAISALAPIREPLRRTAPMPISAPALLERAVHGRVVADADPFLEHRGLTGGQSGCSTGPGCCSRLRPDFLVVGAQHGSVPDARPGLRRHGADNDRARRDPGLRDQSTEWHRRATRSGTDSLPFRVCPVPAVDRQPVIVACDLAQ